MEEVLVKHSQSQIDGYDSTKNEEFAVAGALPGVSFVTYELPGYLCPRCISDQREG